MSVHQPTSSTADTAAAHRDPRLDFCRGLALLMIFVDHVPNNLFAGFTLQVAGFCDATEVFVLVSGIATALAYMRLLETQGTLSLVSAVGRRVVRLYLVHILLLVLCLGLLLAASGNSGRAGYAVATTLRSSPPLDLAGITALVRLRSLPDFLNILPLYMVLVALIPLALALLTRRHGPLLLITASVLVWGAAQPFLAPVPLAFDGWYFNPVGWQLLFVVGILTGHAMRSGRDLPRSRWLLAIAAAYLAFAFVAAAPWTQIPALANVRLLPVEWLDRAGKTQLSLWRLANIAALAYVFAYSISARAPMLGTFLALELRRLGRHALLIFAAGTVLAHVAMVARVEGARGLVGYQLPINVIGILALLLLARWADAQGPAAKERARSSAPRPGIGSFIERLRYQISGAARRVA